MPLLPLRMIMKAAPTPGMATISLGGNRGEAAAILGKALKILKFTAVAMLSLFSLAASPSLAQTGDFETKVPIADAEYTLNVSASIAPTENPTGSRIDATVNLVPILSDLDGIMKRSKLTTFSGDFLSFTYRGTGYAIRGTGLWIKYHFTIDPHHAKPTNGSLEITFRPVIIDGAITFQAHDAKVNVSNDITRNIVRALQLDDKIEHDIEQKLNAKLSIAKLALPSWLDTAGFSFSGASFGLVGSEPVFNISAVK